METVEPKIIESDAATTLAQQLHDTADMVRVKVRHYREVNPGAGQPCQPVPHSSGGRWRSAIDKNPVFGRAAAAAYQDAVTMLGRKDLDGHPIMHVGPAYHPRA